MGEYIKINGQSAKIGTCENLYYTTIQQFYKHLMKGELEQDGEGNDKPSEYLYHRHQGQFVYRFRFPFPDETEIRIGEHEDYNRGELFKIPKDYKIEIMHSDMMHRVTNKAGDLGINTKCVQHPEFELKKYDWSNTGDYTIFEVVQQKPVLMPDVLRPGLNTVQLQTVVRCPYCGSLCRLSELEVEAIKVFWDEHPDRLTDLQKGIIEEMAKGYRYSAEKWPFELDERKIAF